MDTQLTAVKTSIVWLLALCSLGGGLVAISPLWSPLFGIATVVCFSISVNYSKNTSSLLVLLSGVLAHILVLHWLPVVLATFTESSLALALVMALSLWGAASLQFVLFNLLVRRLRGTKLATYGLALPLAWTTVEVLFPQLIPWRLGALFVSVPVLRDAAELFGVGFVGFLALWWGHVALNWLFKLQAARSNDPRSDHLPRQARRHSGALPALLSFIGMTIFSLYRESELKQAILGAPSITVGVVQGNLDPHRDFRPEKLEANVERYRELSRPLLADRDLELLVWPESAVGYDYFLGDISTRDRPGIQPFPGSTTPLLFGGQLRAPKDEDGRPVYWMAAHLVGADGRFIGHYRKRDLFPFSERIPGEATFPALRKFRHAPYELLAGENEHLLSLRTSQGVEVRMAVAICYEDLQGWPTRKLFQTAAAKSPANLIVTLSNDNWFLDSLAASQHNYLALWRAIEFRRYMIRSTNDGFTALIDPIGRIGSSLAPASEGAHVWHNIPLLEIFTLYSVVGDLPLQLISVVTLIIALFAGGGYAWWRK